MALWRIRATVDDRPGFLSVLTASLALRAVNILAVQVHTTEAGAVDDFLVDAPEALTAADLLAAVTKGRGRDAYVARAQAHGLVDPPTRALSYAARLAHDPDRLAEGLGALLEAAEVIWRADSSDERPGFEAHRMFVADPAGGGYLVCRPTLAFTPAEYARAQALVEVADAVLRHHAERGTLLLPDGTALLVRPATGHDVAAVRELHARCSEASRRRRYLGGATVPSSAALRRLLQPASGLTLVAEHSTSGRAEIAGMASLLVEGQLGEISVLVEDAWQRRRLGTTLLRRLAAYAAGADVRALIAHTQADNVAMLRTLDRLGAHGETERDGPIVSVTLRLAADDVPAADLGAA